MHKYDCKCRCERCQNFERKLAGNIRADIKEETKQVQNNGEQHDECKQKRPKRSTRGRAMGGDWVH